MRVVALENYYQEKMKELHAIDRHRNRQEASCANHVSQPQETDKAICKAKREQREALNHLRIKHRRIKTWRFRYADNQGLKVAKRFSMDVLVAISNGYGHIHLWAENLYSDINWNDRNDLRLLSALIRTADIVTIE